MKNNNANCVILPIETARERFRGQAVDRAQRLSRSVARRTSDDAQPCLEYREEIQTERAAIDDLLYAQHCRDALERCIATGASSLRYRKQDGSFRAIRFRRTSLSRVKIWGLK